MNNVNIISTMSFDSFGESQKRVAMFDWYKHIFSKLVDQYEIHFNLMINISSQQMYFQTFITFYIM